MELIKRLFPKKNKNGTLISYGLFWCPFCEREVKKRLINGKIDKSCGSSECKQNKDENNGMYGKKHTEEAKQKISNSNKNKIISDETKQKMSDIRKGKQTGKLNPNWNGGSSSEPYSPEFNKELKYSILERDKCTCQNPDCTIENPKQLQVHHVDFNKKNNDINNLITLCSSCHSKTNGKTKRDYWTNYYNELLTVYL